MKFYNREQELNILRSARDNSFDSGRMTFIVGRRRIGKTALIKKAFNKSPFLYFFVSKKDEKLLCREFIDTIRQELPEIPLFGEFNSFKDLFAFLVSTSKEYPLTLAIDEFQEFLRINPSIYSDMQNIWDANKSSSKLNLVLSGSIFSLMIKIFENMKEPLFGRADRKIKLAPFNVEVLKEIFADYYPAYSPEDLLAFYTITGGVAKYVELLVHDRIFTKQQILDYVFQPNSLLLDEGKNLLIEEFGKEYKNYFSILSLMADSKTSRSEIESILNKNIGGYLERLDTDYNIIGKIKPIIAKPQSRRQKYYINDNFFAFWFRYIYKYQSMVEIENFNLIKKIVSEDFSTFSGKFLEKLIIEELKLTGQYSEIGTYWERGNSNEIDIVAVNQYEKKLLIGEVKINEKKISLNQLKFKARKLIDNFKGYKIDYKGFSLKDI